MPARLFGQHGGKTMGSSGAGNCLAACGFTATAGGVSEIVAAGAKADRSGSTIISTALAGSGVAGDTLPKCPCVTFVWEIWHRIKCGFACPWKAGSGQSRPKSYKY